ncbi:hypothetical protein [Psychrobacter sp. I-STPA10]|uniref:hypothetical protein n=1 Tax=Psychrobacter sp. I-STPA10 TaxID=2585769 RepID=UPI001E2C253F|nr:hypothetical protein [Psychrobacter sp. I-STPA10]
MEICQPKLYNKAPLPFVGQKRNFLKAFRTVINNHIQNDGAGWTIIDTFGGSGLLANNAKHFKPAANVIYNDFDGYSERLKHISDTNLLRHSLLDALGDSPRGKKLSKHVKSKVQSVIQDFDGYIDLQSISTWVLFSGKQVSSVDELFKQTMYNTIRCSDYNLADGYLDGIEIVSLSFEKLLPTYQTSPKTLLILDPPYVSTKQGAYSLDNYFGMVQFLTLMKLVRPPYILFSSTRSEVLAYMDYLKDNDVAAWERLGGFDIVSQISRINQLATYEDNMIYKW